MEHFPASHEHSEPDPQAIVAAREAWGLLEQVAMTHAGDPQDPWALECMEVIGMMADSNPNGVESIILEAEGRGGLTIGPVSSEVTVLEKGTFRVSTATVMDMLQAFDLQRRKKQ